MRDVVRARGSGFLTALAVAVILVPHGRVEAQARRDGRVLGGGFGSERRDDRQPASDSADRQQGAVRIGKDRDSGATFGQAPADAPSPFSAFGGTADRQIRRYRGDNNEINFEVGPSGRNVGADPETVYRNPAMSLGMGFTIDKVQEGYYIPGFGVNGGFAAPERVHGGFYTPGWGVMGGVGDFNGPAATQQVQGGTYIPGFGVGGGPTVVGGNGSAVVGNQTGPAVLGNFGSPVVGFGSAAGGSSVSGGTHVPGFGVSGGR